MAADLGVEHGGRLMFPSELVVLAVRGATAVLVLTSIVGGFPRIAQAALAAAIGLWSAIAVAPLRTIALGIEPVAVELAIGGAIGVVAAVPLVAAGTAGRLVDRLALAGAARGGPYAALFAALAALIFVGVDGHVATIRAIALSHRETANLGANTGALHAAVASVLPAAAALALPWLATALVVELAVGVGARVAGRAYAHVPASAATPSALVMITASMVGVTAVGIASLVR